MDISEDRIRLAKRYEESAERLLQKARSIRSGMILENNITVKNTKISLKCKHGTYTNKFYGKECKPCGSPKLILCSIKAGGRVSHSSKECNPENCKHFKSAIERKRS